MHSHANINTSLKSTRKIHLPPYFHWNQGLPSYTHTKSFTLILSLSLSLTLSLPSLTHTHRHTIQHTQAQHTRTGPSTHACLASFFSSAGGFRPQTLIACVWMPACTHHCSCGCRVLRRNSVPAHLSYACLWMPTCLSVVSIVAVMCEGLILRLPVCSNACVWMPTCASVIVTVAVVCWGRTVHLPIAERVRMNAYMNAYMCECKCDRGCCVFESWKCACPSFQMRAFWCLHVHECRCGDFSVDT
jgi:hypothetical protein